MERVIGGHRRCGKTTKIIRLSHDNNLYILCASEKRRKFIVDKAEAMGLHILWPVTPDEAPFRYVHNLLVDDVEAVLEEFTRARIILMTTSFKMEEMKEVGKQIDSNDQHQRR